MEGLNLENIMSGDEIESLFVDPEEVLEDVETIEETDDEITKENKTTEINPNELFEDESESVGSGTEVNKDDQEDTESSKKGSSQKNNFYSSIAKALQEEGIFPDLDDDVINKISTPEEFAKVFEDTVQSKLDEKQKRIDEALSVGVEKDVIKQYENTIDYLSNIKENVLNDESDKGLTIRKQLIYQDFVNRGYSAERAQREVQKSINGGTDIEDAIEALKSNKEFFTSSYQTVINENKKLEEQEKEKQQKQAEEFKKTLLSDNKAFGEIQLDKVTRQKIYDNITKPVYKDPESGEYYTAIQKYEKDNRTEFMKNVGLLFTLTEGFKNLNGLVKGKVSREVKKGLRELENTLNNTARSSDGNLKFVSGVDEDPEAFIGKGWDLDI